MNSSLDLNGNGILDLPNKQDAYIFQQHIPIGNTGCGLMNWYVASSAHWQTVRPPEGATIKKDTIVI